MQQLAYEVQCRPIGLAVHANRPSPLDLDNNVYKIVRQLERVKKEDIKLSQFICLNRKLLHTVAYIAKMHEKIKQPNTLPYNIDDMRAACWRVINLGVNTTSHSFPENFAVLITVEPTILK